jgi:hypothetical protein
LDDGNFCQIVLGIVCKALPANGFACLKDLLKEFSGLFIVGLEVVNFGAIVVDLNFLALVSPTFPVSELQECFFFLQPSEGLVKFALGDSQDGDVVGDVNLDFGGGLFA